MQMYQVSEEHLNAVLNYLAQKPYGEVINLINLLTNVAPATTLEDLRAEQAATMDAERQALLDDNKDKE